MKLVVGLGNPGKEYANTRHNVGFLFIEKLRQKLGFENFAKDKKSESETTKGDYNGTDIILVKPQTFMNLSGKSVAFLRDFYKVSESDIWIIYDDVDLPLGKTRIRTEGSAGTHNGMKSIIESLGTAGISRLRIGIESRGVSSPEQQDLHSFVLHPFNKEEEKTLESTLNDGINAFLAAI